MIIHLMKNRLKILIRDKELIFWTFVFPFILATLFNMAFSNFRNSETFESIKIGIVENDSYKQDIIFQNVLESVSEGENKLLKLYKGQEETLKEKLLNKEIEGYIIDNKLIVMKEGMNQTIVKSFLDQYYQQKSTIESIINNSQKQIDYNKIQNLMNTKDYINKVSYSKEDTDPMMNYFYSLIAMTCLYGGFWGIKEIQDIQANKSKRAARVNLAPINKAKILGANFLADVLINITTIALLLIYLVYALGIEFGGNIIYVLLTCFIGNIIGILIGAFIGAITKKIDPTSIFLTVVMAGSFLAGMMYLEMKYIVTTKIPILAYINPANLITDSLYSLYYYDTLEKFWINIVILSIMSLILFISTYLIIRRQKYENI